MNNLSELEDKLNIGAGKAQKVAQGVLTKVRTQLGY